MGLNEMTINCIISLIDYGWDEYYEQKWNQILSEGSFKESSGCDGNCLFLYPARVTADYGQMLRAVAKTGEFLVNRPNRDMQIAVGDWAVVKSSEGGADVRILGILPRRTKFSRAAAGNEVKEQIVAANIDNVFIVQSLNRDFNIRRLERYLVATWESGAIPVVVLTKEDVCEDTADKLAMVYEAAPGVDVHAISCVSGKGIDEVRKYLTKGKTVALLGSSGVGKSTLVNTLMGVEMFKTQEIREDDSKGRHTTTHRELVLLPEGGLILDTPGMRSLSLWEAETGMEVMYGDVEELVASCRFHDCTHGNEPGCCIREAIQDGKLDNKRWEAWLKLQKELQFLEAKKEGKVRLAERQWYKQVTQAHKVKY